MNSINSASHDPGLSILPVWWVAPSPRSLRPFFLQARGSGFSEENGLDWYRGYSYTSSDGMERFCLQVC